MTHTAAPVSRPRTWPAVACLVLGVLAVLSSFVLVGALLGGLALVLGIVHLVRGRGRNGLAWVGMALALAGIGLSLALGALYLKGFQSLKARLEAQPAEAPEVLSEPAYAGWIGSPVPEFTLTALDGTRLHPGEWLGRRVILDFCATWSPPSRREIPHYLQLFRETSRDDLLIIGISTEDQNTLQAFVDEVRIDYPVASATDLPAPFRDVEVFPTTFFIDRLGRIQHVVEGYHDYSQLRELALAEDLPEGGKHDPDTQP